ncbi:MAG: glycerol-3-phosphate acyltransferase [Candidatus Paceibacterota bacterium]|jgi:glycerol-3-phosphate acyltransferase PlsY
MTEIFLLLFVFAYLMGSIPFGYLIPKMRGIDIRTIGSKATSSTNVSRALGWRWGLANAILDALKAFLPTMLALTYLTNQWEIIAVALMPVIGHVFPVWLDFKGGKGGAPFYGALVALIGITSPLFILGIAIFTVILMVFKRTSVANLSLAWISSVLVLFIEGQIAWTVYCLLGALIITIALRGNIQRLINGTEPKTPFKF